MADIVISPIARADMREIADYISLKLQNQAAALRLIQRFRQAICQLADFPEIGTLLLASEKPVFPYRYLVCGSYMVFYHIAESSVMVDRVLYGRRDYMSLLFDDLPEEDE